MICPPRAMKLFWSSCAETPSNSALAPASPIRFSKVAAAIAGHADCIVTANLKDFTRVDRPYGIEIVDPDRFIINQWDLDPIQAIAAFKSMRALETTGNLTGRLCVAFDRVGLLVSAQRLREVAELI
jgi:hypothetical protein